MKTDILAFGVHPDDVELSCGGALIKHIALGKSVGIVDLTRGELGTRGTPELRLQEAENARKVIGANFRINLNMKDGFFQNDKEHQLKIIEVLRLHKPEIVLCNAVNDRHPDHGRAAKLISEACFYSGLVKIETLHEGNLQNAWRPKAVYHYIQDKYLKPDFVMDISDVAEQKHKAIMCFSSQFYNSGSSEPETPISSKEFMEAMHAKMSIWGRAIGVRYAEGFTAERFVGVKDFFDLE